VVHFTGSRPLSGSFPASSPTERGRFDLVAEGAVRVFQQPHFRVGDFFFFFCKAPSSTEDDAPHARPFRFHFLQTSGTTNSPTLISITSSPDRPAGFLLSSPRFSGSDFLLLSVFFRPNSSFSRSNFFEPLRCFSADVAPPPLHHRPPVRIRARQLFTCS